MKNSDNTWESDCLPCFCGVETGFSIGPYPGQNQHEQAPAGIQWCESCRLGRAVPEMDDATLASLYEEGGYWGESAGAVASHLQPVPFALAAARWKIIRGALKFEEVSKPVTVLDVGAGQGCLGLVAAKDQSVKYLAVEPDCSWHNPLLEATKASGLGDRICVYKSLDDVSSKADVLVLSHVLEHVKDPIEYLQQLRGHVRPGGLIFIDVPHADHSFKEDVFPHLSFFTPRSLEIALVSAGFDVESSESWGRSAAKSPLNSSYRGYASRKLAWLTAGVSCRVPLLGAFAVKFFSWYFGVSSRNSDGTWVRALGKTRTI